MHSFVCCTFPVCRQHKDVALVNMANVLHRAHFSADAAILAHAALDLTTDLLTSHYTLGNIYAVSNVISELEKQFQGAHSDHVYVVCISMHHLLCGERPSSSLFIRCWGNITTRCSAMSRLYRPSRVLSKLLGGSMLFYVNRSWSSAWRPSIGEK